MLGLEGRSDLSDDEVRNAWRRIAAATHPDRPDGGDPGRFAAAAAAYSELRTTWSRGEASANLTELAARPRQRTLIRLVAEAAIAAVFVALALLAAGHGPAGPALAVGVLTWLGLRLRRLLPRPGTISKSGSRTIG